MQVQLGAVAQPHAQLGGFKARALKAEPPTQRHLYVTEWFALHAAAGVGGAARAPLLVLSSGASASDSGEHRGSSAWRHRKQAYPDCTRPVGDA